MWTGFHALGRGGLEHTEENDPAERYPGCGRQRSDNWLASGHNDFDSRMFSAINDMLLDMLAAVARRDYEQRRERQQQGIARAKREGKYKGRQLISLAMTP